MTHAARTPATAFPPAAAGGAAPPAPEAAAKGYVELSSELSVSLVLVLPLLAAYGVGMLAVDFAALNGVDFVTRYVFAYHGLKGVVLLNLGVVFAFLAAIIRLAREGRFRTALFLPLLVESAAVAWALSLLMRLVIEHLALLGLASPALAAADLLAAADGVKLRNTVLSIGAGVYEELVFRLLLIAVIDYVFRDMLELRPRASMAIAMVVSSILFAAAHHVGPAGEAFDLVVFIFRATAGLAFAVIYRVRSFAVAVYAHALYDVRVLVL